MLGVGAAAWGSAWGRGRLVPRGSLLNLTPYHPTHTLTPSPSPSLPPCSHTCPKSQGVLCHGWVHLHLELWGWGDEERGGLCSEEGWARTGLLLKEDGARAGEGSALGGDLQRGEGLRVLVGRRNTGSLSGTSLCMNEAPEHRGFECHGFVLSLKSVLGPGVSD